MKPLDEALFQSRFGLPLHKQPCGIPEPGLATDHRVVRVMAVPVRLKNPAVCIVYELVRLKSAIPVTRARFGGCAGSSSQLGSLFGVVFTQEELCVEEEHFGQSI